MKDKFLQNIWQIHTDVQEQMMRLRSVPIYVIPDSVKIVGEKLYLKADENDRLDKILHEIARTYNISINEINTKEGLFFADAGVVEKTCRRKRIELIERSALNFLSSSFMPVVDGYIFCKDKNQKISNEIIERLLNDKFPSLNIKRDLNNQTIYFSQEFETLEQGIHIRDIIQNELNELLNFNLEFSISSFLSNQVKIIFDIDKKAKKDSQAAAVREVNGSVFYAEKNEFGKLIKINYPNLIFDISGDNIEKTKLLFESKTVNLIEPNLSGDIEKITRLRHSLSNILDGVNLRNPNLREFIFDASKAKQIDFSQVDVNKELCCEDFDDFRSHILNHRINESQIEAVIKTLLSEDLALIQGPPGTGKSTAIAEIIWQHIRINPRERILLTSETNLAVDNAMDRLVNKYHNLVKPIRIGNESKMETEGRQFSLEVLKRWVDNENFEIVESENSLDADEWQQKIVLKNWIDNIQRRIVKSELTDDIFNLWNNTLSNPTKEIRKVFYDNYVKNCNLIGATCSSIAEKSYLKSDFFSKKYKKKVSIASPFFKTYQEIFGRHKSIEFTTVIQDESSKATPAEISLPLIYGKKSIVIGDHRQLPPMLDKEEFMLSLDFLLDRTENELEAKKIRELKVFVKQHFNELEISHFERLFNRIDVSLKGVFNLQYRMHPDINDVIKQFYIEDGGLECGLTNPIDLGVDNPDIINPSSRYHGIETNDFISKENHVIWIDTDSPELLDGTSRINYGEIEVIREVLLQLKESDSFQRYQSLWESPEEKQIGVISFYGKQLKLLQDLNNEKELKDIPIRISTVDRFQGMERNIIIVSMVRSNRIATHAKQKPDFNLYPELGFQKQESLGFAQSPNRLNVALSRAKRLLIIVGNSQLFRQKNIYDNVFNVIQDNPNSKIIKYSSFDYTSKIPTPTALINRSLNLNTRDIKKNESHLRNMDTWFTENKESPKIAVLELSTKAVKMLLADQEKLFSNGFDFSCFVRDAQKTETGNGLDVNNRMNLSYFKSRVLPAIQKRVEIIKQNNVDVLYCVATAAYRTASNREDIVKVIKEKTGVNVRILSKNEEAEATFWAYSFSTRYRDNFIRAKNIVMIDQGGGSTEIAIFKDQKLVKSNSFEIGTTVLKNLFFQKDKSISVEKALNQIDKESTDRIKILLQNFYLDYIADETYCVCVGTAITEATPGKGSKGKHDKILTRENLLNSIERYTNNLKDNYENIGVIERKTLSNNDFERLVVSRLGLPLILEFMNHFNINSLNVSGTGLWYGIFFKELYKID